MMGFTFIRCAVDKIWGNVHVKWVGFMTLSVVSWSWGALNDMPTELWDGVLRKCGLVVVCLWNCRVE